MQLTSLQTAMINLDMRLTGKSRETVISQIRHKPGTVDEWLDLPDSLWYLSDGGYSRIAIDAERLAAGWITGLIFLASESLATTRANWEGASEEIRAVEHLLVQWLRETS